MSVCPTCGGTGRVSDSCDSMEELVEHLKISAGGRPRDVYEGGTGTGKAYSGTFRVTYGGPQVSPRIVQEALAAGLLISTYGDDTHVWRLKPDA